MTIASELELLRSTKSNIAEAIRNSGVDMPEDAKFSEYGDYIRQIGMTDWGVLYTTTYPNGKELTEADYLALGGTSGEYELSFGTVASSEITGFDFGKKPTTTPIFFLYNCQNINRNITIPRNITSIGDFFLYYSSFNQEIVVPGTVKSIGANFLSGYPINANVTLENGIETIGNGFLSSCLSLNKPIILPDSITSIGRDFLSSCKAFNNQVILSNNLNTIGDAFMMSCESFNQPLTLPVSVEVIGDENNSLGFMRGMGNFTGVLHVQCPASVIKYTSYGIRTTLANFIRDNSSIPSAYTQGVKLAGTYAEEWKAKLPDILYSGSGSDYCRKLILVNN